MANVLGCVKSCRVLSWRRHPLPRVQRRLATYCLWACMTARNAISGCQRVPRVAQSRCWPNSSSSNGRRLLMHDEEHAGIETVRLKCSSSSSLHPVWFYELMKRNILRQSQIIIDDKINNSCTIISCEFGETRIHLSVFPSIMESCFTCFES